MSTQFFGQPIAQISVEELALCLQSGSKENLQLVDVREPEEVAIARLESFDILPLSQFAEWADSIATRFDPHAETIVMCHHGIRSAQMCQWLSHQGFTNVKNVAGGIDAYSLLIDPTVPQY
jgi:rhodanese-related sulfurtransferase